MGTPGDKSRIGKVVSESSSQLNLEKGEEQPPELQQHTETTSELSLQQLGPSTTAADMTVLSRLPSFPLIDYPSTQLPSIKIEHSATSGVLEQAHIEDYYSQTKYYQPSISETYTKTSSALLYSTLPTEKTTRQQTKTFQSLDEPGPSGLQTPKTKPIPTVSKLLPKRSKKAPTTSQTTKKSFACQYCQKSFQNPANLAKHQQIHVGSSPFKCEHCKKSFTSKFKLVRHVLIHSDRKPFSCTVCERTFHRKDHLKNHVKVHSPSKKVYTCPKPDCKKEYTSLLSFKKHSALHAAEEGSLECLICSKKFETKDEILYHLKIHAGSRTVKSPNEKKFTCDQCERKFFTRKDVRRHMVVHTGMRDFLCQFCPQRFGRKDRLVRHIKKSHSKIYPATETQPHPEEASVKQEEFEKFETIPNPESAGSDDNILDIDTLFKSEHLSFLPQASVQQVLADLDSEGLGDSPSTSELISSESVVPVATDISPMLEEGVMINESEIIGFPDPRENLPLPAFSKTFQSPPQP